MPISFFNVDRIDRLVRERHPYLAVRVPTFLHPVFRAESYCRSDPELSRSVWGFVGGVLFISDDLLALSRRAT